MIANVKATEGVGDNILKKTIHEGSESIMFSVLQETQYMYPVKSSVREIVSNSLDSINERNNAIKILDGDIKVSDLFIEKEGTEFADSRFNTDYYKRKWLSDNDEVLIRYIENDSETRDRIQFIDNGVGLGGDRLIKYFSLGFSTKRLSKNQLGSFGLGAKSLLATGVDYYTVTSRYNGREYKFDVYKDHVSPALGRFNEDGTENKKEKFYNDYVCFYKPTKKLNGVIIEAEVKRHRKQDYISAISNQLGYINNIKLVTCDMEYGGVDYDRNIANKVLFSTDKILVGESDYYAKPQILLTPGEDSPIKISYGAINFDELEMKRYGGNVSFIMNINEVDVTPSRENVIWNNKTRNAIKSMFEEAQQTVSEVISDKLKNEKYLSQHLTMLESFRSKHSIDGLAELYKVIDTSKLNSKFKTFSMIDAVNAMDSNGNNKRCIFSSTEVINSYYYNARTRDTNWGSALSNKYLAYLSVNNNNFNNVIVYIGDTKSKNLARYCVSEMNVDGDHVSIIYLKKDLHEELEKKVEEFEGIDNYLEDCYKQKDSEGVIYGEIYRAIANGIQVLKEEDIDKTLLGKLDKEEEEQPNNRWLSAAERAKKEGKVQGIEFRGSYSSKEYFNEATFKNGNQYIIFNGKNKFAKSLVEKITRHRYINIPDRYRLVSFSDENFKRFKDLPGVDTLTNALYKIEFGDLHLTHFGASIATSELSRYIKALINQDSSYGGGSLSELYFLDGKFANVYLDGALLHAEAFKKSIKTNEAVKRDYDRLLDTPDHRYDEHEEHSYDTIITPKKHVNKLNETT